MRGMLVFLLFANLFFVSAADHYVRDGASGDGSSWSSAWDSLPSTLIRGDTYYIADGNYGSHSFSDSGASMITIKKATVAEHGSSVGWLDGYGDGQAVFGEMFFYASNYVIDGQVGGGPDNWMSGHGIKIKVNTGNNVLIDGSRSNIGFYHVDMENGGRDTHDDSADSVEAVDGFSNLTFSYCYIHDVARVMFLTRGGSDFTIEYSMIKDNGGGGDSIHREAWSGDGEDNVIIRYNIFEDISNTGFIAQVNGNDPVDNWQVYGNVFWYSPDSTDSASGIINIDRNHQANNFRVYNNLIANVEGLSAGFMFYGGGSGNQIYNNMWYNNVANTLGSSDYGWFYGNLRCDRSPCINLDSTTSDSHKQIGTGNPFVDINNRNFRLGAPTQSGIALSSPFNIDPFGNIRGGDGVWDRGAYEFGGVALQTCSEQGFYCCPSGSICSDVRAGTGCSGSCCASQSACQAPQTCSQLGGDCCLFGQTCSGSINSIASDCSSCCIGTCINPPTCGDGSCSLGETCVDDSCCGGTSYNPLIQLCCSGVVGEGECCSIDDCSSGEECVANFCVTPEPTCESSGYFCCTECASGAQPGYDSDCSGVCCAECVQVSLPESIGLWLMFDDDISDGRATDSSSNNIPITCSGTNCPVYLQNGGYDGLGAYQFDGLDDYLFFNHPSTAPLNYPVSISAWVKTSSSDYDSIVSMADSSSNTQYVEMQKFNDGRAVAVSRVDATFDPAYSNVTINDGEWHHVVAVFTNESERRVYVDGGNIGSSSFSASPLINNINIGRLGRSSATNYFSGLIDDVRVYSKGLSDSEVLEIFEGEGFCVPVHEADNQFCGDGVSLDEINAYLSRWVLGEVSLNDLLGAVNIWKGN